MLELHDIDLSIDPAAAQYVKDEIVQVVFAKENGVLLSREGPNSYESGDAMITGSTGDRWSVSRIRFEAKYQPVEPGKMGADGPYHSRPVPVLGKQMRAAFSIRRSAGGDVLQGSAHDWLLQYAPGDYGVVEKVRFEQVYRQLG